MTKEQYWKHREKRLQEKKEYYIKNKIEIDKKHKKWYDNNSEQVKTQHKEYRKNHKIKTNNQGRLDNFKKHILVLQIYSEGTMKCKFCGFDDIDCLDIDHINNDGAEHRRKIFSEYGGSFSQWLIKNNFPDGFQVLCKNCNWRKQLRGIEWS